MEGETRASSPVCPHLGIAEEPDSQRSAEAATSFCYAWRTPMEVDEERQSYYCRTEMSDLCPRRALGAMAEVPAPGPEEHDIEPATPPTRRSQGKRRTVTATVAAVAAMGALGAAVLFGAGAISPAGAGGSPTEQKSAVPSAPPTAKAEAPLALSPDATVGQVAPTRAVPPSPSPTALTGVSLSGGSTSGATATPVPPPTPNTMPYLVPYGDTLTKISIRFGVSIEELMKANDIADRDMILSGRTIVIPNPRVTLTPTPGT